MNCPICNRPLGSIRIEEHHLIPKTFKGKETISLHGVCHRKIHSVFTERELQHYYFTIERLLENEHIQTFVKWVSKRPPEFYDSTKETSARKSKRY
jgi:hypothetical protein